MSQHLPLPQITQHTFLKYTYTTPSPMANHYETLHIAPTAPIEVIRAAYEALVLAHQSDKALHFTDDRRAAHDAAFRAVQDAWDVMMLKISPPTNIRLTTASEKAAMRAKVIQELAYLRDQRSKRDAARDTEAAQMSVADLIFMMQVWETFGERETDMRAHCNWQCDGYKNMLAKRKHEESRGTAVHEQDKTKTDTGRGRSTSADRERKHSPSRAHPLTQSNTTRRPTNPASRALRPNPSNFDPMRASLRSGVRPPPPVPETWAGLKEKREAARLAGQERKAKAVREEKGRLERKKVALEQEERERIAKVRAKARRD
ncbi:hypothetical protein CC80DRAFT_503683 [Byssothecium circinans]|uniref:J domain-containing protein n=1 Tax=Byssothecium circinans TaxID=147558 RepID=A0A6A5TWQ7_9PLEO|nr:hypothetical protein CC80DRAFT_503683 [Byssothecium circinans]